MVNWANLPYNLLQAVLDRLYEHKDCAVFSSICRDWRCAWKQHHQTLPPMETLLTEIRDLYKVRVPREGCWHGLSYGWLACWVGETRSITLISPDDDGKQITTPPLIFPSEMSYVRPQQKIYKAILTADPKQHPHDFALVVIFNAFRQVAYCKPNREENWTVVDRKHLNFLDIILHRGLVFAVASYGNLIAFDVNSDAPGTFLQLATSVGRLQDLFFVETSRGELLLVLNQFDKQVGTSGFKLYKLILDERSNKLVGKHEVTSLATGDAVFHSHKNTFCVPVKGHSGCQPNSIYFSIADPDAAWMDPWMSIAIFDLANKETRVLSRGARRSKRKGGIEEYCSCNRPETKRQNQTRDPRTREGRLVYKYASC